MSNQELDRKVRGYGQPGLRLLGFKPRSALQDYHNVSAWLLVRACAQVSSCLDTLLCGPRGGPALWRGSRGTA